MAPTVSLEQLVYATRLMNTASGHGKESARLLRDWWVESDSRFDPQAYVLRPDVVLALAGQIIAEPTPYLRTRRAALVTLECLRQAAAEKQIPLPKLEARWLDKLSAQAEKLPEDENELIAQITPTLDAAKVRLAEYILS